MNKFIINYEFHKKDFIIHSFICAKNINLKATNGNPTKKYVCVAVNLYIQTKHINCEFVNKDVKIYFGK